MREGCHTILQKTQIKNKHAESVYAVPNSACPFSIDDPRSSQSTILITHVNNESGQPEVDTWFLNASTTDGSLNFTATPSSVGLLIVAGNNALNASVTFLSATEQGYSVSQVSNVTVGAMQAVNFTAPCMMSVIPWLNGNTVDWGCSVPINVTLANRCNYAQTFNVTVYANDAATSNSTVIATFTNVTVGPDSYTTLTLIWNTVDFSLGDYIISANAALVSSETGTAYNVFAGAITELVQSTNGGNAHGVPHVR